MMQLVQFTEPTSDGCRDPDACTREWGGMGRTPMGGFDLAEFQDDWGVGLAEAGNVLAQDN